MTEVIEKCERCSVREYIGFGRSVTEELNVNVVFINENEQIFKTVDGWLRVTARGVDMDCKSAVERSNVQFFTRVFRFIKKVGRGGWRVCQ